MHAMALRARRVSAMLSGIGALDVDATAEPDVVELTQIGDSEESAPLPFRQSLR